MPHIPNESRNERDESTKKETNMPGNNGLTNLVLFLIDLMNNDGINRTITEYVNKKQMYETPYTIV